MQRTGMKGKVRTNINDIKSKKVITNYFERKMSEVNLLLSFYFLCFCFQKKGGYPFEFTTNSVYTISLPYR